MGCSESKPQPQRKARAGPPPPGGSGSKPAAAKPAEGSAAAAAAASPQQQRDGGAAGRPKPKLGEGGLQALCADLHNYHRRDHRAPELQVDEGLARNAQTQAEVCLKTGQLVHGTCANEGQSIFKLGYTGWKPTPEHGLREAIQDWYDHKTKYLEAGGGLDGMNNGGAGYFTQLVWKETTRVGLGVAQDDSALVIICNYSKAGNLADDYHIRKNVWCEGDPERPQAPDRQSIAIDAGELADLKALLVSAHNKKRAQHRAPPLVHDDKLAADAQKRAEFCLKHGVMDHGDKEDQGQNIYTMNYAGFTPQLRDVVSEAVEQWYNEISLYEEKGRGLQGMLNGAMHFTQVVWKETTRVGLGIARGKNDIFIVANYQEEGNIADEHYIRSNVWLEGDPDVYEPPVESRAPIVNPDDAQLLGEVHLEVHNSIRRKHGAPGLIYDAQLAAHAQAQAEKCLEMGRAEHGNHEGEGQNIYMMTFSGCQPVSLEVAQEAVHEWCKELEEYKRLGGGKAALSAAGHFTQVVWKGTQRVGMGIARSSNSLYLVANYAPPGNLNVEEAVRQNVEV